jgi:hypothetical protein
MAAERHVDENLRRHKTESVAEEGKNPQRISPRDAYAK